MVDRRAAVLDTVGTEVVSKPSIEVGGDTLGARGNALVADDVATGKEVIIAKEIGPQVDRIPVVARFGVAAYVAGTRLDAAFASPVDFGAVAHVGLLWVVDETQRVRLSKVEDE